jgi:hypothetical protein
MTGKTTRQRRTAMRRMTWKVAMHDQTEPTSVLAWREVEVKRTV